MLVVVEEERSVSPENRYKSDKMLVVEREIFVPSLSSVYR
jgi:hypothetical protein